MLIIAIVLLVSIGLIHSYLGEKYLLIRLFKRDNLPHLFGSDWFTKQTLRFAWHITTIAWWGFAAILGFILTNNKVDHQEILLIISTVFLLSGIVSVVFSKGKHLSWIFFFFISYLNFYSSL